jgi:hypothetical protein
VTFEWSFDPSFHVAPANILSSDTVGTRDIETTIFDSVSKLFVPSLLTLLLLYSINWPNPDCSIYLPVSTSRLLPVLRVLSCEFFFFNLFKVLPNCNSTPRGRNRTGMKGDTCVALMCYMTATISVNGVYAHNFSFVEIQSGSSSALKTSQQVVSKVPKGICIREDMNC